MGIHAIFRVLDKVLHRPVETAANSGRYQVTGAVSRVPSHAILDFAPIVS